MSQPEMQRKMTQQGADIDAIYETLTMIGATQTHHGRRLNDVEAQIVETETRLTARLEGIDGRLNGLNGDIEEVLRRLPS